MNVNFKSSGRDGTNIDVIMLVMRDRQFLMLGEYFTPRPSIELRTLEGKAGVLTTKHEAFCQLAHWQIV